MEKITYGKITLFCIVLVVAVMDIYYFITVGNPWTIPHSENTANGTFALFTTFLFAIFLLGYILFVIIFMWTKPIIKKKR